MSCICIAAKLARGIRCLGPVPALHNKKVSSAAFVFRGRVRESPRGVRRGVDVGAREWQLSRVMSRYDMN